MTHRPDGVTTAIDVFQSGERMSGVAATLALLAAVCFALAATLWQKAALSTSGVSCGCSASPRRSPCRVASGRTRPRPRLDHSAVARHDGRVGTTARVLADTPGDRCTRDDGRGDHR